MGPVLWMVQRLLSAIGPGPADTVEWSAPSDCPDEAALVAQVEAYLGEPWETSRFPDFRVSAQVTADSAGYTLALTVSARGGRTEESRSAATCDELLRLAALKIAFALDPMPVLERYEDLPDDAPSARASPAASGRMPPPVIRPEPPRERTPRAEGRLRIAGGARSGLVGPVGAVVALAPSLVGRGWRAELEGAYGLPVRVRDDDEPGAGADFQAGGVALRGCAVPRLGPVELATCGGVEGGWLRGDGLGVGDPKVRHRPWLALTVGPGAAWPLHPRSTRCSWSCSAARVSRSRAWASCTRWSRSAPAPWRGSSSGSAISPASPRSP
jgi:hypothetical protein